MANRYWNPSADANWTDANVWATTPTGDPTGIPTPTSEDNVYFTSSNNKQCGFPSSGTYNMLNIDCTGYTGTFKNISGLCTLNVYGSVKFVSGITWNPFWCRLNMRASSGIATIELGGKYIESIAFYGAATFKLIDKMYINSAYGNSPLALCNESACFDANGQEVELLNSTNKFATDYSFTGTNAFYKLTINGLERYPSWLFFDKDIEVTNTFTVNGYNKQWRILLASDEFSNDKPITITAATVSMRNIDIRDIKGAGTANWNLSSIPGGSGDCGGNSNITFTTATNWYWHADTGNFDDYSKWYTATNGGGTQMSSTRTPLPQDTCYFDANSFDNDNQIVTNAMFRFGSMIWTGATHNPKLYTTNTAEVYGSITLIPEMTLENWQSSLDFCGRGSYTLTSAGKTWTAVISIRNATGTLTLQDDLKLGTNYIIKFLSGTFDANDKNIYASYIPISGTRADKTTINMGSGTWEISLTSHDPWSINAPENVTLNCETSTIKLKGSLNNNVTFNGGNKTYYNFWNNSSPGSYNIIINGSNTFNDFKIDAGLKMQFTNNTTQTFSTFTASGTSSNLIILRSTGTTNATLTKVGGGTISCDYMDVDYITGNPDKTWCMGTHSIDGGHNSQIYFTDPPAANTSNFFQLF